jgi:hypothetical protein
MPSLVETTAVTIFPSPRSVMGWRRAATPMTRGQKEIFPRHGPVEQRCSRTAGHMSLEFNGKARLCRLPLMCDPVWD